MSIVHGDVRTRDVTIGGVAVDPERSLAIWKYCPTGFGWGHGGGPPTQLALALLLELGVGDDEAFRHHYALKWRFIAPAALNKDLTLDLDEIVAWCRDRNIQIGGAA